MIHFSRPTNKIPRLLPDFPKSLPFQVSGNSDPASKTLIQGDWSTGQIIGNFLGPTGYRWTWTTAAETTASVYTPLACVHDVITQLSALCSRCNSTSDRTQQQHGKPSLQLSVNTSLQLNKLQLVTNATETTHQWLTVSAAVRLMPSPPARVLSRNTKMSDRVWKSATMSRRSDIFDDPSNLTYVCFRCQRNSCKHTVTSETGKNVHQIHSNTCTCMQQASGDMI